MMKNSAFTLLELVVVIVVIGLLSAMVVPKFASAQSETTIAAATEDLRTISRAIMLYQGVNGSYPVNGTRSEDAAALKEYFKDMSPFEKLSPIGGVYDYLGPFNGNPIAIEIVKDGANQYTPLSALELDTFMDNGELGSGRLLEIGDRLRYRFACQ